MFLKRVAVAAVMVMLLGVLGACGEATNQVDGSSDAWRTSTAPVDPSPLVWAGDNVVHLADGTAIDLGGATSSYVVAGDGVFFVPAADREEAGVGSTQSGEVHFVEPNEKAIDTGLRWRADTLSASPDGRYLVGIDVVAGPKDDYGTPLAEVAVHDLVEGREVVRTSYELGDTESDLAHLYAEAEIGIAAATNDTVFVDGANGTFAIALATGEIADDIYSPSRMLDSKVSPDDRWKIKQSEDVRDEVIGPDGASVPLDTGASRWVLNWWVDSSTVVGSVIHGPGVGDDIGPENSASLMTCTIPEGSCRVIEESRGALIRYPNGTTYPLTKSLLGDS